jgi:hypothetical protein
MLVLAVFVILLYWLIDLFWVRALTVLMHPGLIDGPFVPHNLQSAQHSPVPLPKLQMAPRLKILMSSGCKNGTQYTIDFSQIVPASESPPGSPTGPQWREIPTYGAFLHLSWYTSFYLSLRVRGKGAPFMFPNRARLGLGYSVTKATGPLIHSIIHSFIHSCISAGVPKKEPSYIWGKT